MTGCCHPFTGACEKGPGCPVRETPCPAPVDEASAPLPVLRDPTFKPLLLAAFTVGAAFGGAAVQV